MDEHGHIKTQFDDLLDSIKNGRGKPVSVHALAAASGMAAKDVRKWVEILEKDGRVRMHNSIGAIFVSWADPSDLEGPQPAPQIKLEMGKSIDVGEVAIAHGGESASDLDILIAQHHEEMAKSAKGIPGSPISLDASAYHRGTTRFLQRESSETTAPIRGTRIGEQKGAQPMKSARETKPQRVDSKADVVNKDGHLQKIGDMLSSLRGKKAGGKIIYSQPGELEPSPDAEKEEFRSFQPAEAAPGSARTHQIPGERLAMPGISDGPEGENLPEKIAADDPEDSLDIGDSKVTIEKMEAPKPMRIAGVPIQFSDRLSKHLKKIEAQTDRIKSLRADKEKLLNEQYAPIQRKLESELETVSDRILGMEKNIMEMRARAIGMPEKIGAVDKMQLSTLKAHDEIRRTYDEASVLIEESNSALSEERDKIESMLEKGRQEIAQHNAKTNELSRTLERITQMEDDSANKVLLAREALSEQAQQLASAEKYSSDLRSLKAEIQENIESLKASVSATKGVLSGIEKQMGQMRQIEEWSGSIRDDYNKRISELDGYIREGNHEFETLRESVESNFVRKYLKELRAISNDYEYEFNEARITEKTLDQRISEEKARLEALFEEGKNISRIFETQSREPDDAGKFDSRKETFDSLPELSRKRGEVEEMIAEVVHKQAKSAPLLLPRTFSPSTPPEAKRAAEREYAPEPRASAKHKPAPSKKSKASKKKGRR